MRTVNILSITILGVLIGLILSRPVLADDNERYTAFMKDQGLRQSVINAAAKSPVIIQNPCASAQYSVATVPMIAKPIEFDDGGHPYAGMLKFPVKEEGCSITRWLNVLVWVQGPGKVVIGAIAPGTTIADLMLQKDASLLVLGAAVVSAPPDAACNVKYLADTEFLARENPTEGSNTRPIWHEKWTVVLCNKKIVVPVKFTPDQRGIQIVPGGPETRVFDLNGPP